jgi:hypothetical protein
MLRIPTVDHVPRQLRHGLPGRPKLDESKRPPITGRNVMSDHSNGSLFSGTYCLPSIFGHFLDCLDDLVVGILKLIR